MQCIPSNANIFCFVIVVGLKFGKTRRFEKHYNTVLNFHQYFSLDID